MDNVLKSIMPSKKLEVCEENLIEFFEMIHNRQEIWYNRFIKQKPAPWCSDKILNNHKFCNVYRELDKTSQWIIKNVILDDKHALIEKVWRICILRLFNTIPFFEVVELPTIEQFDSSEFYGIVQEVEKYFASTNKKAYAINSWLAKGTTQGLAVAKYILPSLHENIGNIFFNGFIGGNKVNALIKSMTDIEGIGKFVSHEWYSDFCYINKYTKDKFNFDENEWTNVGPGAILGLSLLLPSASPNIDSLGILLELSKEFLPKDFKYISWDIEKNKYVRSEFNLTIAQMEFSCCEYQKYVKIKHKIGKQRDKFKPTTLKLT